MTGEQRSGDGWQEKREKGKRGVRVEDGDFFFWWLVGRKTFSGRFWGGSIWREGDSGIISNVWFSHVHVFFIMVFGYQGDSILSFEYVLWCDSCFSFMEFNLACACMLLSL